MDVTDTGKYITGFGDGVAWFSGGISKVITWAFSIRNIFFFVIIVLICIAIYHLYKQETLRKKYYFNHRREI